jgi:hypothetical protein
VRLGDREGQRPGLRFARNATPELRGSVPPHPLARSMEAVAQTFAVVEIYNRAVTDTSARVAASCLVVVLRPQGRTVARDWSGPLEFLTVSNAPTGFARQPRCNAALGRSRGNASAALPLRATSYNETRSPLGPALLTREGRTRLTLQQSRRRHRPCMGTAWDLVHGVRAVAPRPQRAPRRPP